MEINCQHNAQILRVGMFPVHPNHLLEENSKFIQVKGGSLGNRHLVSRIEKRLRIFGIWVTEDNYKTFLMILKIEELSLTEGRKICLCKITLYGVFNGFKRNLSKKKCFSVSSGHALPCVPSYSLTLFSAAWF